MPFRRIKQWFEKNPLFSAVLLVATSVGVGFWVASTQTGKLQEDLQSASITLVAVALIGGFVGILLNDFQRTRERRSNQVQFLTNVLADLKSVYDRVERTRILIPAHQSALTYGNEMRDLIEARVQLRNVVRALDRGTSGIPHDRLVEIRHAVQEMEGYLESLTDEFRSNYKSIANKQKAYEARVKTTLEKQATGLERAQELENEAWNDMVKLSKLKGFIGQKSTSTNAGVVQASNEDQMEYAQQFEAPLDFASWLLRSEIQTLLGGDGTALPPKHAVTRDYLTKKWGGSAVAIRPNHSV